MPDENKNDAANQQDASNDITKDVTQNDVFEDIFQHIDIDTIDVPVSVEKKETKKESKATQKKEKKSKTTTKKKTVTEKTKKKKPVKKIVAKKTEAKVKKKDIITPETTPEKKKPVQAKVTRNVKAKNAEKKQVNNLNIEDISAYIESTKAQQEKKGVALEAQDGTDLKKIPGVYAIVPHVKGDHKLVFFKDVAPSDLLDDDKNRTKGSTYVKKSIKIYDVHADFKEHPILKSKDGQRLGVWLIEHPDDLMHQLQAIQEGKGGGTNFKDPLIIGVVPQTQEKETPAHKVEEIIPEETVSEKPVEEKASIDTGDKKPRDTPVAEKKAEEKKPWDDPVPEKTEEEKKPRDNLEQTPASPETAQEKKPRDAKDTETKEISPSPPIAPKEEMEETAEIMPVEKIETKQEENTEIKEEITEKVEEVKVKTPDMPFSNAVETLHDTDSDRSIPPPAPINLDDLMGPTGTTEPVQEESSSETKEEKVEVVVEQKADNKNDASSSESIPTPPSTKEPQASTDVKDIQEKVTTEVPSAPSGSLDLDNMFSPSEEISSVQETSPPKEAAEVHPIYQQAANLDTLMDEHEEDNDAYEPKISNSLRAAANEEGYEEHDDEYYDDEEDDHHPHMRKKIAILLKIFLFLAILGGLIWLITTMFFSGTSNKTITPNTEEENNERNDIKGPGDAPFNNIPKVVPEEELDREPIPEEDTGFDNEETIKDELEQLDTNFTLPELRAKIEAQMLEAQKLLKDATFINDKKAIMFASTAETRAATLLSDIEQDSTTTAKEVQDAAEKIDYYITQATKILQ